MMNEKINVEKIAYFLFSLFFMVYLFIPSPKYPDPPANSVRSMEEADTEIPEKNAYFTDFNREEVVDHYSGQYKLNFLGWGIPNYRLNYPPEDSETLIRDQTRSTFLEEIVYPFRESFYVNGFKPSQSKDEIWYKGIHYYQKITVKVASGSLIVRLAVGFLTLVVIGVLYKEWKNQVVEYKKLLK